MFSKIKNKLNNLFKKSEEVIEETPIQDDITEEKLEPEKKTKPKKEVKEEENLQEAQDLVPIADEPNTKEDLTDDEIIEEKPKKQGFFGKTFGALKSKKIDESDFDKIWIELEIFLLEINIAFEIVQKIEEKLREKLIGNSFNRFGLTKAIKEVLVEEVSEVLSSREADFIKQIKANLSVEKPVKILVLGVNGTGKTTTIAKVVKYLRDNNLSVVVAAADTFRAAAVEQLDEHAKKLEFRLIKHKGGSDPAAVAFDAIEHAKAKNIDVVLIDTAGRMPNNSNLMLELQKVKKVSNSQMAIFVGDSISGNDLIDQIELFDKGVEINGVILTKVDTDEKPGSIVTTAYSIEKPIFFLGTGQTYDDLVKFDSKKIAKQLFDFDESSEE